MSADPHTAPSDPLEAAASAWLAWRDRGLTPEEQDAYLHWLRVDPAHGRMIARLEKAWAELDLLAEWRPEHSAVPNPDLLAGTSPAQRRRGWLAWTLPVAAAAALVLGWLVTHPGEPAAAATRTQSYVTEVGAHRAVELADGSVLELNTDTALQAIATETARTIRLARGEAWFKVAKDPDRPFAVHAGGVTIRAVGTAFAVHRRADGVDVLVTEGRVEVAAEGADWTGGQQLAAFQRMVIPLAAAGPGRPAVTAVTDQAAERLLAWRHGRLEFMAEPLREVAAAFGRHSAARIVIADPALADLRIGGSFRAGDVEAFVRALESNYGVQVDRTVPLQFTLHRGPGP